jgi:hypothetical protein
MMGGQCGYVVIAVCSAAACVPFLPPADAHVTVNITASFVSQLLLLGPAASHWSTFVALHLPDAVTDNVSAMKSDEAVMAGGAARAAAVQQLLCLTAADWAEENDVIAWMRERLLLPLPWLHNAQVGGLCCYT